MPRLSRSVAAVCCGTPPPLLCLPELVVLLLLGQLYCTTCALGKGAGLWESNAATAVVFQIKGITSASTAPGPSRAPTTWRCTG